MPGINIHKITTVKRKLACGFRSVGGLRISLYNAITLEEALTLVDFMKEFQQTILNVS